MPRALRAQAFAVVVAIASSACYKAPEEPIKLEGNLVTVSNVSTQEWTHVEIWINQQFRMVTPSIPPGKRFQATLDTFVTGFGHRFNFKRMQVKDVRLMAKLPDGKPMELKMPFYAGGLEGAFGGKR
jgi:hypothetical protein